jgi:hypothetical protein
MANKLNPRALAKHRRRFLRFFPNAFRDQRYLDWEHSYKWRSHKLWIELLNQQEFKNLLRQDNYLEIASRALRVEQRTVPPFLFSFEKMALRDALRTEYGAQIFSEALFNLLNGKSDLKTRFVEWIVAVGELPRKQSRVLSWPNLTFFPFIAQPTKHIILKPSAMRVAAAELGYDLEYSSKPSFATYERLLKLADLVGEAIADLNPRNYHDLQTFLYVIGSAEYEQIELDMAKPT